MTSIVIVDDEDTDQLHSSSKLPPKEISSHGNCVDHKDEITNKIKDTGEHSKIKNTNKQSSMNSSSRAQMNKHSNEVSNDLINHTSGNEQKMYASNLEDKSNSLLNSCI